LTGTLLVAGLELVVFDLDGTLVDSSGDLAAAVRAALERMAPGTPPLSLEQVRAFIGNGARALVERSLAAAGIRRSADDVLPVFLACYEERLLDTTLLYPGARAALDGLGETRLAVLTNKPGALSRRLLEGLGLTGRFERIVGGGDLPQHKPDPAGLRWIMEQLGAAAERSVMVGDSAVDVRTGRAAGVFTVGYRGGYDPEGLAAEPPDLLLDDLAALPERLGLGTPDP
jgi:phosphoglycolate phosphatase